MSLSILIIDDSPSERARLGAMLTQLGHQVTACASGGDGLDALANDQAEIDLVLLDVLMPGIDGFETARCIREWEQSQGEEWHPIIFLSGRTAPENIAEGVSAGGDDYLVKPVNGVVLKAKIAAMQRIATMRQRLLATKQQLEIQANTDELTQLPNRRHFLSILDAELSRAKRHNTPLAVAYLDLDNFKKINDNYSHKAGDAVLRAVAKVLSDNLRTEDSLGRIGGEEFCFCLPGTGTHHGKSPCERYRALIEGLSIECGESQRLAITASFGVTSFIPGSDDASQIIARADKALYQAKEKGRNRVEVI